MSDLRLPRPRTAEERATYVAGFTAGWKAAAAELDPPHRTELLRHLDTRLDLLSAVENSLRAAEAGA